MKKLGVAKNWFRSTGLKCLDCAISVFLIGSTGLFCKIVAIFKVERSFPKWDIPNFGSATVRCIPKEAGVDHDARTRLGQRLLIKKQLRLAYNAEDSQMILPTFQTFRIFTMKLALWCSESASCQRSGGNIA